MRVLVIIAAGFAVAGCAHWGFGGGPGYLSELAKPDRAFSPTSAHYFGIEDGETPSYSVVEARNFPLDSFGRRFDVEDFRLQVSGDRLVVDTIRTGDEDDSVEAQHARFIFLRRDGEWRFDRVLARYRCYRGRPDVWTDSLCS